jgi:CRP/FNR family transcriptional regulator, cyclic AMP receptor protein
MKKSVIEVMQATSLFKGIAAQDLEILAPLFTEKKLSEGTTVFVENMPGESLYLIGEGTVQISKMIAEGREKTLAILGPEDFFGEMAILDGGTRSATARVVENACLLRIRKSDFETLCDKNPRVALKLMHNIIRLFSRRIRENKEEYMNMLLWALDSSKNA